MARVVLRNACKNTCKNTLLAITGVDIASLGPILIGVKTLREGIAFLKFR